MTWPTSTPPSPPTPRPPDPCADRAAALSEAALHRLVARLPPDLVGEAVAWGWRDSVVRDELCSRVEDDEQLLAG